MSRGRVAAVIPTIGRPELRRAVESVIAQTHETRAIVVNDRPDSRSDVYSILEGLDYEYCETEGGVRGSAARNMGVKAAEEPFVAFLDDDDSWAPTKIERQLAAVRANGGHDIVASCLSSFDADDGRSRVVPEVPFAHQMSMSDYLFDRSTVRLRRHFMQTSSLLGSREVFERTPWDETLRKHQDWDLLIRLAARKTEIVVVRQPLVSVQQGSAGSVSSRSDWKHSLDWFERVRDNAGHASRGDFLASVVMRSALRSRDWKGAGSVLAQLTRERPHIAALIVGFSGVRR